jgi:hypothetical protein
MADPIIKQDRFVAGFAVFPTFPFRNKRLPKGIRLSFTAILGVYMLSKLAVIVTN